MNNSKNKFIRKMVQQISKAYQKLAEKYLVGYITDEELIEDIETEGYYFAKNLKEKRRR